VAFIDYIPYDEASPQLQELYRRYGGADSTPANIIRIAGHNPKTMEGHMTFHRAIMYGDSPLTRHQREMIGVVVSALNNCHY